MEWNEIWIILIMIHILIKPFSPSLPWYTLRCVCVIMCRSVSPGCVNALAVCVDCVLNACSSYPCHSGHRPGVYRRLPGVAQLEETEHQEHELRQPCLPQDHRGGRRRNPHRPQRADRPRLPCSEWQCQTAIPSTATGGWYPRPGSSLVLRGTYAVQRKVNKGRKAVG